MTTAKKITTPKTPTKPEAAPRRARAEGGQTGANGTAIPNSAPARAPSESTDRNDGSPAPSPASSTLVRFPFTEGPSPVAFGIVAAVFAMLTPAEVDALARVLLAFVKVANPAAWLDALAALDASPHSEHGRRILGALGAGDVDLATAKRPESFGDDLFAVTILGLDRYRQHRNPALDALLRDVAAQVERDSNGSLATTLCGAMRVARGELLPFEREPGADPLACDLAFIVDDLRRDLRHAATNFRGSYSTLAASRRHDTPDVIAMNVANLRRDRAELARVAALVGRVAAAVAAAEPRATEAA